MAALKVDAGSGTSWEDYESYNDETGNDTNEMKIAESDRKNIESKREYVNALVRQQNETERMARQFAAGNPIVNTAANQRLALDQSGLTYRTAVQNAAERGLVHSGALGHVQATNTLALAQKYMALLADEESGRRQRIQQIEQQQATTKQARAQVPEEVTVSASGRGGVKWETDVETFTKERAAIDRSQKRVDELIGVISQRNLDENQLFSQFSGSIEQTFSQAEEAALREAQSRGFSEDAIAGIRGRFAQEKQRAYDIAAGVASGVTKTTTEEVRSTLASLYNADVVPLVDAVNREPNGSGALLGGAIGAFLGGALFEGAGVMPGYQIGSGAGAFLEGVLYG